jgi:hypothetical protein
VTAAAFEIVASADGTPIAVEQVGDGPPVVLIGGAFNDRSTVAGLAAVLAPDFTVVTYDRRGRGDSGDSPDYAVEREVEDLAAVIARAGGKIRRQSGGRTGLDSAPTRANPCQDFTVKGTQAYGLRVGCLASADP